MATVSVRYIVHDVDAAIGFYCRNLGFTEVMRIPRRPSPMLSRIATCGWSCPPRAPRPERRPGHAGRPGARSPAAGTGFSIEVPDLAAKVEELRAGGARFRNEIVTGVGGKQILLDDPSGNPIELFRADRARGPPVAALVSGIAVGAHRGRRGVGRRADGTAAAG